MTEISRAFYKKRVSQKHKKMKETKFSEKALKAVPYLSMGKSIRQAAELAGYESNSYLSELMNNPEYKALVGEQALEFGKQAKGYWLSLIHRKIEECIERTPKKDIIDYIDMAAKLMGYYVPTKQRVELSSNIHDKAYANMTDEELIKKIEEQLERVKPFIKENESEQN